MVCLRALACVATALATFPPISASAGLRLPTARTALEDGIKSSENHILNAWDEYSRANGGRKILPKVTPLITHTAMVCNLTAHDTLEILTAIKEVAGPDHRTFIITISNGGMTDIVSNMLWSLEQVSASARRLVVGIGGNVCNGIPDFTNTTCIEVFKYDTAEAPSDWGTQAYYDVIVRKHAILTMAAISMDMQSMIYSDPDIVYLKSPSEYLEKYSKSYDITFSENNCLVADPEDTDDYPPIYETKGIESLLRGKKQRRVDINTGLFYVRRSNTVSKVMLKTMQILNEGANGHARAYQQYSMAQAMKEVADVKVGVAEGDRLVNGNLYWGHRGLLDPDGVISVHANWMSSSIKKECLKSAGLWHEDSDGKRFQVSFSGDVVRMDRVRGTIMYCGDEAKTAAASTTAAAPTGALSE